MKLIFYGPPNYLSRRFTAEDRRAFAFWGFVAALIGAFFFGGYVWYVTALSVLALISNFTAETPVEPES